MQKKISLITANCKRCGKELLTASQSLWGLNKQKKEFGVVCTTCATQEETASILHATGKAIQATICNKVDI